MVQFLLKTARSARPLACLLGLAAALIASPAFAESVKSYAKTAAFDDVRFELSNAIIDSGLSVQSNGNIGDMLKRTGADVGSSKAIYKNAEYFTFCSAKLSRAMMEAEPLNVAHCPYVVFIYVSVAKPGDVVVGYKTHPTTGSKAAIKAFADIDKLLDRIAKQAVQ